MSEKSTWDKLIDSTRKSARSAAELSATLYELVNALQSEAIREQEAPDNGPENPTTS